MKERPGTEISLDELQSKVHVWFCHTGLISDESRLSAYQSILSAAEIERYHRFKSEEDKHSYLISHAMLRTVLSRYLDVPAKSLQFSSDSHGKPGLVLQSGMPDIKFNLTHTNGLSACIITLRRACGIDAENIHRNNNLDAVARRMFADEELDQLNSSNMQLLFFYYWTLREAYVKSLGTGLAGSSKDFYFDIDADALTASIHYKEHDEGDRGWQFSIVQPTSEHVLSVAVGLHDKLQVEVTELMF